MQNLYSIAQAHKNDQFNIVPYLMLFSYRATPLQRGKSLARLTEICMLPSMTEPEDEKLLLYFSQE